jgi:ATP-dependent DNA helicase RecG
LKGVGPNQGSCCVRTGIYKYVDLLNFFQTDTLTHTVLQECELQNNIAEVQIIGKIINIKTVEFVKPKRLVATL